MTLNNFEKAQQDMVQGQLRPNRVTDPVILDAFSHIPRHIFVPRGKEALAYADHTLVFRDGLYMVQPLVLARLLQLSMPCKTDRVLDLTPATGYSSALLLTLVHQVIAVFHYAFPLSYAAELPECLKKTNFFPVQGETKEGYPSRGPYDIILIAGAVEKVPQALFDQLAPQGRLVTIIQDHYEDRGKATRFTKTSEGITYQSFFETSAPPLPAFVKEHPFAI